MFFFLSKTIGYITHPVFLFLLILILLKILKKPKGYKYCVLFLYLVSTPLISDWLVKSVELKPQRLGTPHYDYVIVLGGFVDIAHSKTELPEFNASVDRILQGVHLVKKGIASKLIFTGGSGDIMNQDDSEADMLLPWLEYQLDESQILIESKSRNTYENALYTKDLLSIENSKVLLVTSAFHMKRALGCFNKLGYQCDPYPVDFRSQQQRGLYKFLPNERSVLNTAFVFKEWLGTFVYKLKGYI